MNNVIVPMVIYKKVEVSGELVNILDGGRCSIVAALCSVGAVICYLLCYNFCTERVKVEQKTEKFELCAQPRAINLTGGNPV